MTASTTQANTLVSLSALPVEHDGSARGFTESRRLDRVRVRYVLLHLAQHGSRREHESGQVSGSVPPGPGESAKSSRSRHRFHRFGQRNLKVVPRKPSAFFLCHSDCLNCQALGGAPLEVEAEDSDLYCPPGNGCPMAPNFLLSPMGSTNFMRLSLKKGADVDLSRAACRKFGVFASASAWALRGLNKTGRSPFRCCLSRVANQELT